MRPLPARRSLARRIRRSRRRRFCAVILGLLLLGYVDRRGWLLVPHIDDLAMYHGARTRVMSVIDGDTFDVAIPDALHGRAWTRIRLWGLDSPEPAARDRPAEPFADESAARLSALTEGAEITLRLEPHRPRGTFGRVLAHVEIEGIGSLNVALLESGLAVADERWPHQHLRRYAKAQRTAQQRQAGVWRAAPGS